MVEKVRPMSPDELIEAKFAAIPSYVIEEWNQHLFRHFNGCSVTIYDSDILRALIARRPDMPPEDVRRAANNNGYLKIGDLYAAVGWIVERNDYGTSWTFTRRV